MIDFDEYYKIGKIGKPHGVKGELSFHFSDDVFDRTDAEYLMLCIDGLLVPFFMEEYRFRSEETALVKFCDIDTQERASELTGCEVFFERNLSDNDEGHVSWAEIIGFTLADSTSGNAIGRIASVDETTINILFELEDGKLIPASEELIRKVDTKKKEIEIELPEGILDL